MKITLELFARSNNIQPIKTDIDKNILKNCNFMEYAREVIGTHNCHFESRQTYKFAKKLVDAINNESVVFKYFPTIIAYRTKLDNV